MYFIEPKRIAGTSDTSNLFNQSAIGLGPFHCIQGAG